MEEMAAGVGIRRVKGIAAYDGTDFAGWQAQNHSASVQEALERSLGTILNHPVRITASGRTDKGVHALGQVFHFDTGNHMQLVDLTKGANAVLPKTVRIRSLCEVNNHFHARFSARRRQYRYFVTNRDLPFINRYTWVLKRELDIHAMSDASLHLIGEHDFSSFGSPMQKGGNTVRFLKRCEVRQKSGFLIFTVEANAFLRLMVRNMIGALLKVGFGRWEDAKLKELVNIPSPGALTPAPPQGLFLWKIFY
jgi:tRNA pseudouridine38-40 synthase